MDYATVNAIACQCAGIKPSQSGLTKPVTGLMPVKKADINASDTAGLYQYNYTGSEGLELECWLEYEAAEKQSYDCPGQPECIELIYVLHKGEDISEVLSEDVRGLIEESSLEKMAAEKDDADEDRAIARWEDRQAA